MTEKNPDKGYVAILGWSISCIDALERFDRRYVIVAPEWAENYAKEHGIPHITWDFERLNDRSLEIAERLKDEGVDVAIPLFEETVEWAGAINAVLMGNPRLHGQAVLFRDKALMKRRAQLGGIRVGIFEEAHDHADIVRFLKHLMRQIAGKLLIIWDGLPAHRGHRVKQFLHDGAAKRLHLEQLPGYAPDLNPDEGAWHLLKGVELKNLACTHLGHLAHEVRKAIKRLRQKPWLLRACVAQVGLV
jgi:transposase